MRYLSLHAIVAGTLLILPGKAVARLPSVLTQGKPAFQIRPRTISYTGDGTGIVGGLNGTSVRQLGRLHWTTYTRSQARTTGLLWLDACSPSCASGRFTSTRVHVHVFAPVKGRFLRLTLSYRYKSRRYLDQRKAHYYDGISGASGYWEYAICGVKYTPQC